MKDSINNQKGIICVSIIFISLITFVLLSSLTYALINNIESVNSNNDNYRANYISESILEVKIVEIMKFSDVVINEYLLDLQRYKIEYLKGDQDIEYDPPKFSNYATHKIIPYIKKIGGSENSSFKEYEKDHYYKIDINYDSIKKVVNITSLGRYKRARKFINANLELPKVIDNGFDEYNLPKVSILPINIVEYYHTIGL